MVSLILLLWPTLRQDLSLRLRLRLAQVLIQDHTITMAPKILCCTFIFHIGVHRSPCLARRRFRGAHGALPHPDDLFRSLRSRRPYSAWSVARTVCMVPCWWSNLLGTVLFPALRHLIIAYPESSSHRCLQPNMLCQWSLSLSTIFHLDLGLDACMDYDRHSVCLSGLRTTTHISIRTKTAKAARRLIQ